MARYKPYDLNQTKMIPLSYADQVVEGSFEHALNEIVEEHLDLSVFEHRYHNDATGRSACDRVASFKAPITACRGCHSRERCLRHPDRTPQRQLTVIKHPEGPPPRKRENRDGPTKP